jgi:hypothetical protein
VAGKTKKELLAMCYHKKKDSKNVESLLLAESSRIELHPLVGESSRYQLVSQPLGYPLSDSPPKKLYQVYLKKKNPCRALLDSLNANAVH